MKAEVSPNARSHIGVVFRLPDNWNGRVLGIGGGGWQGDTNLRTAQPGLNRGYAVLQTNGGHDPKTGPDAFAAAFDSSWAKDNPEGVTDFAWRAVHLTSVVGKQVAARYYAKPLQLAVFQGCSTGGRMALMEARRFPDDYGAVIAGAPVFNLGVQTAGLVKGRLFTTEKTGLLRWPGEDHRRCRARRLRPARWREGRADRRSARLQVGSVGHPVQIRPAGF